MISRSKTRALTHNRVTETEIISMKGKKTYELLMAKRHFLKVSGSTLRIIMARHKSSDEREILQESFYLYMIDWCGAAFKWNTIMWNYQIMCTFSDSTVIFFSFLFMFFSVFVFLLFFVHSFFHRHGFVFLF